jgi:hypothetical protein
VRGRKYADLDRKRTVQQDIAGSLVFYGKMPWAKRVRIAPSDLPFLSFAKSLQDVG